MPAGGFAHLAHGRALRGGASARRRRRACRRGPWEPAAQLRGRNCRCSYPPSWQLRHRRGEPLDDLSRDPHPRRGPHGRNVRPARAGDVPTARRGRPGVELERGTHVAETARGLRAVPPGWSAIVSHAGWDERSRDADPVRDIEGPALPVLSASGWDKLSLDRRRPCQGMMNRQGPCRLQIAWHRA